MRPVLIHTVFGVLGVLVSCGAYLALYLVVLREKLAPRTGLAAHCLDALVVHWRHAPQDAVMTILLGLGLGLVAARATCRSLPKRAARPGGFPMASQHDGCGAGVRPLPAEMAPLGPADRDLPWRQTGATPPAVETADAPCRSR